MSNCLDFNNLVNVEGIVLADLREFIVRLSQGVYCSGSVTGSDASTALRNSLNPNRGGKCEGNTQYSNQVHSSKHFT